jgi:HAD superfamily hydrolase (TIGR01549 family)
VIKAVFFDWGNTLAAWEFDPALYLEGHRRGLDAFGPHAPAQEDFTEAFGERVLPRLLGPGDDEIDYTDEVAAVLESLGAAADDDALDRFVRAENLVWRPRHELEPTVLELLDRLRERGVKVGLVSNLFDPPQLMRELFSEIGLLDRLDALAVSAEVGKRKPSAAIFEAALVQAGVTATEAMMVGDRLREDIGGAQAVGMSAIQATWFAQDDSGLATPDGHASEPADVLRFLGTT